MVRGVKPRLTSFRSWVCRGGSMWISCCCMSRRSASTKSALRQVPRSEEKSSGSFETSSTCWWRVRTQKPRWSISMRPGASWPRPLRPGCQWTGECSCSHAKNSCGTPRSKVVGSNRSICAVAMNLLAPGAAKGNAAGCPAAFRALRLRAEATPPFPARAPRRHFQGRSRG